MTDDYVRGLTPAQRALHEKKRRERKKKGFWFTSGQATLGEYKHD